jgi:chromosome transmission fidelity protein 4
MAAPAVPHRIIPSYPHAQGLTKLAYSYAGKYLITAGADQLIRKFTVDEESKEPETFEQHADPVTAVAAARDVFASASEDCTVSLFRMENSEENVRMLTRCTLPIRDIAFSPDGEWLGVASEYTIILWILT